MLDYDFLRVPGASPRLQAPVILISSPLLDDFYFDHSVILLVEHNHEGSVGFVLNKPLQLPRTTSRFPPAHFPLYIGGPVDTDRLYFVHTLGNSLPRSVQIGEGLWWGGDHNVLQQLIDQERVTTRQICFFVGYAGWVPAQLRTEIDEGSWAVAPFEPQYLGEQTTLLWQQVAQAQGDRLKLWINFPDEPTHN